MLAARRLSIAVRTCPSSTTITPYLETSLVPAPGFSPSCLSRFKGLDEAIGQVAGWFNDDSCHRRTLLVGCHQRNFLDTERV